MDLGEGAGERKGRDWSDWPLEEGIELVERERREIWDDLSETNTLEVDFEGMAGKNQADWLCTVCIYIYIYVCLYVYWTGHTELCIYLLSVDTQTYISSCTNLVLKMFPRN